ncbi:MAG TPA: DNA ligase [Blastocatellia bacterium]|nr:DNA ligase [Blastocatellia bacterium]HNG31611.1 DNA ligase [Blastocatellia bacterium]
MIQPFIRFAVCLFLLPLALCGFGFAQSQEVPRALLANVAKADIDPAPYLVSEKYDGVRALWDGKVLRSRAGNVFAAPAWFLAKLPRQSLDGELWIGRGQFEKLSGAVRKASPQDDEWRQIKYMIFELPDAPGTFAERYEQIKRVVAQANFPQLVAVEQFRLPDNAALRRKLDEVVRGGGEGLMLHRADALFVAGRSDALLKLKPLDDTEATVIGYVPGKGKYTGKMGALQVETADGKRFQIGTGFTDAVRANPPAIGTVITFTYRGLTKNGLPRFASYLRIREKF